MNSWTHASNAGCDATSSISRFKSTHVACVNSECLYDAASYTGTEPLKHPLTVYQQHAYSSVLSLSFLWFSHRVDTASMLSPTTSWTEYFEAHCVQSGGKSNSVYVAMDEDPFFENIQTVIQLLANDTDAFKRTIIIELYTFNNSIINSKK